jgi:hypothetical protein
MPPGSDSATPDVRVGGSTPPESLVVWDFDASVSEYMDYLVYLSGYSGGGLTVVLPFMMSSAASGKIRLEAAIRALVDRTEDFDSAHTYLFNGVSVDPVPTNSGEVDYPVVTFTDGADMDSWADGELAILRVWRDYNHADDNAAGDLELLVPIVKET